MTVSTAPMATEAASDLVPSRPPSPIEESARLLREAVSTDELARRCRLLSEAVLLDPRPGEARLARAESACAPASELIVDARAVFAVRVDVRSASCLAQIATRAKHRADALRAAKALSELPDSGIEGRTLGAKTFALFGEHLAAARLYAELTATRLAKGAVADATDAELHRAIETARIGDRPQEARAVLRSAIGLAAQAATGYGDAWVGLEVVEAIAALRNAGDEAGAKDAAQYAQKSGAIATAESKRILSIERAIADARSGNRKPMLALLRTESAAERLRLPAVRALFATNATLARACGEVSAHARAHAWLREGVPRLDDDMDWARRGCPTTLHVPTLIRPQPDESIAEALRLRDVDPLRARAMLAAIVDAHPGDPAPVLALSTASPDGLRRSVLDQALARHPDEPWLHIARVPLLIEPERGEAARLLTRDVLPRSLETQIDARATAPAIARILAQAPIGTWTQAWADVAEALLRACRGPASSGPCLEEDDQEQLQRAVAFLRAERPEALASHGPLLSNDDLKPRVRLDVILALLGRKHPMLAESVLDNKRGSWSGPEASLASAAVYAHRPQCKKARADLANAYALRPSHAVVFETIERLCPP